MAVRLAHILLVFMVSMGHVASMEGGSYRGHWGDRGGSSSGAAEWQGEEGWRRPGGNADWEWKPEKSSWWGTVPNCLRCVRIVITSFVRS